MIHIEITGIPGSGKSFLIKELDEYLNQNGYRTYTNKTLIILYMKNISKTIKITSKFLPQKISNYIAYKLFVNHRERIIKKTIENKQFYQSLIKIVNSKVLDIVLRKSISKWIFNSIVYKSIADEYLSSDDIFLQDEGLFHRVISIFNDRNHINKYLKLINLPSMLFKINIDKEKALSRIVYQGKKKIRLKTIDYINNSNILIDQAINNIKMEKNKMIILELDEANNLDSNLEIILNQIKNYKIGMSS